MNVQTIGTKNLLNPQSSAVNVPQRQLPPSLIKPRPLSFSPSSSPFNFTTAAFLSLAVQKIQQQQFLAIPLFFSFLFLPSIFLRLFLVLFKKELHQNVDRRRSTGDEESRQTLSRHRKLHVADS
jgi:hypothetical protein